MGLLSGKTVIITGASRGIGAAAVVAMAEAGAGLMLLARSQDALEAVAAGLRRTAPVETMTCDIADFAQVAAAVERTRAAFGRIDVLVNNAGVIEPIGPLAKSDPAEFSGGGLYMPAIEQRFAPPPGEAVVHAGKWLHRGLPIDSGRRVILVGFLRHRDIDHEALADVD